MKIKKNKVWIVIPTLVILGAIIKQIVVAYIPLGTSIEIIPSVFNLGYAKDYVDARYMYLWYSSEGLARLFVMLFNLFVLGLSLSSTSKIKKVIASVGSLVTLIALFGLYEYSSYGNASILIGGTIGLGAIYFLIPSVLEKWQIQLAWCIQLAGGIGNFIEMNIRGYVVDYLHFLPNNSNLIYNLEDWLIRFGNAAFITGIMIFGVTMIVKWALEAIQGNKQLNIG